MAHQKSWERIQASTAPSEVSFSDDDEEAEEYSQPRTENDFDKGELRVVLMMNSFDIDW